MFWLQKWKGCILHLPYKLQSEPVPSCYALCMPLISTYLPWLPRFIRLAAQTNDGIWQCNQYHYKVNISKINILRTKVERMHLPTTFMTTKRGSALTLRAVSAANKHLPSSLPTFGCPNQRWRMAVQQPATQSPPPPRQSCQLQAAAQRT